MTKFLGRFSSHNFQSLVAGMGSVFSICQPDAYRKSALLGRLNKRLKDMHKDDGLYREYDYNNPATIEDCWQDTGKILGWAMHNYEKEQHKKSSDK